MMAVCRHRGAAFTALLLIGAELWMGAEASASPTKLKIGVLRRPESCSQKTRQGDVLSVISTGKIFGENKVFDEREDGEPFTFILGHGQVIDGWDLGLLGMCPGEVRRLVIPSDLGYGKGGAAPYIPGDVALVYEIELVSIEAVES